VVRRLILDTSVLIAYERRAFDLKQFDDDDLAIAALCVAEFRTGIELAPTSERARASARTLDTILQVIPVLDYTAQTATCHARLRAHTRHTGRPRGPHDLIIAAHGVQTGYTIASFDAKARFGDLPGVTALDLG